MQLISRDVISLCYCNLITPQPIQSNTTIFITTQLCFYKICYMFWQIRSQSAETVTDMYRMKLTFVLPYLVYFCNSFTRWCTYWIKRVANFVQTELFYNKTSRYLHFGHQWNFVSLYSWSPINFEIYGTLHSILSNRKLTIVTTIKHNINTSMPNSVHCTDL